MKLSKLFIELSYALNESQLLDEAKEFSDKRDYDLMMHVFKDRVFPVLATAGVSPTPDVLAALTDFPQPKVKAWLDANNKRNAVHGDAKSSTDHNIAMAFNNFKGSRDMHQRDAAKLATYVVSFGRGALTQGKKLGLPKKQQILSHLGWSEQYLEDVLTHTGEMINTQVEKLVGKPVDVVAHALTDTAAVKNSNKLSGWKAESTPSKKQMVRSIINDIIKKDPAKGGQVTTLDIARQIYKPAKAFDKAFDTLVRSIDKLLDARKDSKGQYVNSDMFDLHTLLKTERQTRPGRE